MLQKRASPQRRRSFCPSATIKSDQQPGIQEEYDSWRYNYSEADLPGIHVKVTPSQELSDALIRMSKEEGED